VSSQPEQAMLGSMNVWDAKTNPPELTHHRRRDSAAKTPAQLESDMAASRCACCSPRGTSSSSEESRYSRRLAACEC
jgi:hypothetical protein